MLHGGDSSCKRSIYGWCKLQNVYPARITSDLSGKGLRSIIQPSVTASVQCLTTTMKCIALVAIEVLNKPLSEDKLRNIWQHVVHKAYNTGDSAVAESPRQVKEEELHDKLLEEMSCMSAEGCDDEHDRSSGNDKYPAPSTPQLKQVRLLDDASCHDQTNWSAEKGSAEHCEESKSVETTCCNAAPDMPVVEAGELMHESVVKEENDSADAVKVV